MPDHHFDPAEPSTDTQPTAVADGGDTVRPFSAVRHSDTLVRSYTTPPGNRLYAYRADKGDHHVVVSRGDEPKTQWDERVPATITRPIPGQKLWTIPDNWQQRFVSQRDTIKYALYYVEESDVWAEVSIPTNNWLTDAWYRVKAVGDLDVTPVGDLASSYEVRQHADEYEASHDTAQAEQDAELLRLVADNWDTVEEELRLTTEWVRDEGLDERRPGDQPISADSDWQVEFSQDTIFRPLEALKHDITLDEYDMPGSVLLEQLREVGLPDQYCFQLMIDESVIDMEYYVQGLIETGASAAEAVDYYMVEVSGLSQTEWANKRGVAQATVSGNISDLKQALN